jgi:TM2 domain-containing membrane protein YozV
VPASSPPFVEEAIAADEPAPAPRAPAGYAGAPPMGQINRQTIGMLAILIPIGALGIHKFILGKNTPGLIMLLVSLFGCGIGYVVMLVIGILEGIKYLRMSDAEFYETYVAGNKAWL